MQVVPAYFLKGLFRKIRHILHQSQRQHFWFYFPDSSLLYPLLYELQRSTTLGKLGKNVFKRMFIYIVFTNKIPLFFNHITYLFEHDVCCLIILYNCVVSAHYLTLLLPSYFVPLLAVHCHLSCLMVSGKVMLSKSEALCQVLPDSPLHARCPLTLVLWRSSHGYFGHWEIMTTFFRC